MTADLQHLLPRRSVCDRIGGGCGGQTFPDANCAPGTDSSGTVAHVLGRVPTRFLMIIRLTKIADNLRC